MIVNFRYTKWFLMRFLFALSVILNLYAMANFAAVDKSLEACENHISEIEQLSKE